MLQLKLHLQFTYQPVRRSHFGSRYIFREWDIGRECNVSMPSISSNFRAVVWWVLHKPASVTKTYQAPCLQPCAATTFCMTAEQIIQRKSIWPNNNPTKKKSFISNDHSTFTWTIQILLEAWERSIRSIGQIIMQEYQLEVFVYYSLSQLILPGNCGESSCAWSCLPSLSTNQRQARKLVS